MRHRLTGWLLTLLLLPFAPASLHAADAGYSEDIEYVRIKPPVQTSAAAGKVEVVEVFWYGCPHCFQFEPTLEKWLKDKPDYIEFVRMPAIVNPSWEIHARAYYAAKALGVLDKTHGALFHAIHDEKQALFSEDQLVAFYARHGVKEDNFRAALHSFSIEGELRRAKQLGERYGLNGVPTLIVNGKYRTSASQAGDNAAALKVAEYLAAQEHAASSKP
jgi:thiol:disulfide interchange protein DsbA